MNPFRGVAVLGIASGVCSMSVAWELVPVFRRHANRPREIVGAMPHASSVRRSQTNALWAIATRTAATRGSR